MIYYFCAKSHNTTEAFSQKSRKFFKAINYLLNEFYSGYFTKA